MGDPQGCQTEDARGEDKGGAEGADGPRLDRPRRGEAHSITRLRGVRPRAIHDSPSQEDDANHLPHPP